MHDGSDIETRQSPGAEMRRRILDVAARSLAENGYQATTLRAIAQEAGLKAGSIYYHFASKEQITVEVLNEGVDYVANAVREAIDTLPGTADGTAILSAAIDAHLEALSAHRAYSRASIRCFSMVPANIREQTVVTRRKFDALWLDILQGAQAHGAIDPAADVKVLHRVILGALNWTIEQRSETAAARHALATELMRLLT